MISLSRREKNVLYHWKNGQSIVYRKKLRAGIIWQLAQENKTERQVAENFGISIKIVKKWRDRFIENRLDGLYDLHRSGAPRKFSVPQRCEVIAIACDQPKNYGFSTYTHWTLDILTKSLSQNKNIPLSEALEN